jgi:thioredoxin 1
MATIELTKDNFKETIDAGGTVLIDFWAEWCGPCKSFAPHFEAASEKHADIIFGKVDTESQRELAGAFGIRSIPTVMVFRESIMLFNQGGSLPPAALDELIKQVQALDMDEIRAEIEAEKSDDA